METYKPFDEYLKKHKYDPKTNTIEINGKRQSVKTDFSPKEMNRINKYLRENDYDPKTETIATDSIDPTTNKKRRVKLNMTTPVPSHISYNHGKKVINGPTSLLSKKPNVSNFIMKHEEGHMDDNYTSDVVGNLKGKIGQLKEDLYKASPDEKKKIYDEINKYEKQLKAAESHKKEIDSIKDRSGEFTDKQINEGNTRRRRGSYQLDHDIEDIENYADTYATRNTKYNKKNNDIFRLAQSSHDDQRKRQYSEDTTRLIADKDVKGLLDLFKDFYAQGQAMEKSGCLKELNITYDDLYKYINLLNVIDYKKKQLHDYESKIKNDIKVECEKPYKEKLNSLESSRDWMLFDDEDQVDKDAIEKEMQEIHNKIDQDVQNKLNNLAEEDSRYNKMKNGLSESIKKAEQINPVKNISNSQMKRAVIKAREYIRNSGAKSRRDFVNSIKESCLIMDNDEFFMEASKNPAVKARRRTVNNLRKLGVDRAHEVDNRKLIDKLERQIADLKKKYDNKEISFGEASHQKLLLKKKIRSLEKGVDINIKDSYGNKHKVRLTSDKDIPDTYDTIHNQININPETMNSNKFDSSFNHEAGHAEQNKRFGLHDLDTQDYNPSDKDDYPIKCAKLFLLKNKDKMNSHDVQWTELHADFLSCKKSGFGKMIKDVYSFKKSKKEVEDAINNCIKHNEEERKELEDGFFKIMDKNGNVHTVTQKDVDECIALYNQAKGKFENYYKILEKRWKNLFDKMFESGIGKDYAKKVEKVYRRVSDKKAELAGKLIKLGNEFEHNGIYGERAFQYEKQMEELINGHARALKELKTYFTTYDYRIKFMEDMKHIHDGHPERCSMKYPPVTPADKKYMQEFSVEEMFISNIITEAEYVQLQERIQMITERSE